MTSATTARTAISPATAGVDRLPPVRVRLKPDWAIATGYVDGGWWPRSRDLVAELPGLLAALAVRLGRIERVSYQVADWGPTVRKISVGGGGVVRLGGFCSQRAATMDVLAARRRVTLLVVPPETSSQTAQDALMAAARGGNADGVEVLLAGRCARSSRHGQVDNEEETAHQRWEFGGRLHGGS